MTPGTASASGDSYSHLTFKPSVVNDCQLDFFCLTRRLSRSISIIQCFLGCIFIVKSHLLTRSPVERGVSAVMAQSPICPPYRKCAVKVFSRTSNNACSFIVRDFPIVDARNYLHIGYLSDVTRLSHHPDLKLMNIMPCL